METLSFEEWQRLNELFKTVLEFVPLEVRWGQVPQWALQRGLITREEAEGLSRLAITGGGRR